MAEKKEENIESKVDDPVEDIQLEITDDTPPEDRNRTPLPPEKVKELEDDDLTEYSEKVQRRLKEMKKVWHDERREKERAVREAQEALEFARVRDHEARQLRQRLGQGEKVFVSELSKAAEAQVAAAKRDYQKALQDGDAEQITAAQEAMMDAKIRLKEVSMMQPSFQGEERGVESVQQVHAPARPQPDPKAQDWARRNTWFGVDTEMTSLALGLHEKLVSSGVDPKSDEYYRRVDEAMRKRFPEAFDDPSQEKPTPRAPATVVAPASRSSAPRKVQLSASQVAVAKKLGLSPEVYAKELLKLSENR